MSIEKENRWHQFYMKIAFSYADLSKDPRTKVGSIIVPKDFSKILSVGYNGWAKGEDDIPDSLEPGKSGTVHSEINCMIKFSDYFQSDCYLYCTHSPCKVCSRAIVNFDKISCLVYNQEYRDIDGLKILENAGIKVIKIDV